MPNNAIVVTSIAEPTAALETYLSYRPDWKLIVIGDAKSPLDWEMSDARFVGLVEQLELPLQLPRLLPENHYSRKNLGYLLAAQQGAQAIVETDDDNRALPSWSLSEVSESVEGQMAIRRASRWVNPYPYFTGETLWPRGFPLRSATSSMARFDTEFSTARCPVQQFLAEGDPDVDAVHRLVIGRTDYTFAEGTLILPLGSITPFNSQSTLWFRSAFMYMYLPSFVSFRMTDIWRSFIAQVALAAHGWHLAYHGPAVHQDRNEHDLLRDFEQEIPGYLHNERLIDALFDRALSPDPHDAGVNLRALYETLVAEGFVPKDELFLVDAWVNDLEHVGLGHT